MLQSVDGIPFCELQLVKLNKALWTNGMMLFDGLRLHASLNDALQHAPLQILSVRCYIYSLVHKLSTVDMSIRFRSRYTSKDIMQQTDMPKYLN